MAGESTVTSLVVGAIGGAVASFLFRLIDQYVISPRFSDTRAARKKLIHYAQPLGIACRELEFRLKSISDNVKAGNVGTKSALGLSLSDSGQSIDWYTKQGYYLTSTTYLIASVSAWIQLYERDVAFLKFGKSALTTEFHRLIDRFKVSLSRNGSILWYHYVSGIGEVLLERGGVRPISLADFTKQLCMDKNTRGYCDQVFVFLNRVSSGAYLADNVDFAVMALCDVTSFLERHRLLLGSDYRRHEPKLQ